ncbi:hypothetical protein APY04_2071 [Hyphomicrobium sulfonivorans]|uniref:Uncharacterized protein n=1 Tax=Hyphomicrobium sulfonivorans TaxID=121290 RepID=A0A109BE08_HYPSL|nr:hypothetical protein [Hyphomicrobium sulfonivorans]KWT67084.1 hypothetical protein APY04_2071 [Hyphomicrobium sulfonivorans]
MVQLIPVRQIAVQVVTVANAVSGVSIGTMITDVVRRTVIACMVIRPMVVGAVLIAVANIAPIIPGMIPINVAVFHARSGMHFGPEFRMKLGTEATAHAAKVGSTTKMTTAEAAAKMTATAKATEVTPAAETARL